LSSAASHSLRIGITASSTDRSQLTRYPFKYVDAVEAIGARAVVFENDLATLDAMLESIDGIIVSGGRDVAAARYGGDPSLVEGSPSDERDAFEIAVVLAARDERVPTACICRGMQIANVAFGGTLIEDLAASFADERFRRHRDDDARYAHDHIVRLEPLGRLAEMFGSPTIETNSMHHQALRDVAPAFRVTGRTDDGVIEAVEATFDHPLFVGVQWHPEKMIGYDEPSRRFFRAFGEAAEAYAARNAAA